MVQKNAKPYSIAHAGDVQRPEQNGRLSGRSSGAPRPPPPLRRPLPLLSCCLAPRSWTAAAAQPPAPGGGRKSLVNSSCIARRSAAPAHPSKCTSRQANQPPTAAYNQDSRPAAPPSASQPAHLQAARLLLHEGQKLAPVQLAIAVQVVRLRVWRDSHKRVVGCRIGELLRCQLASGLCGHCGLREPTQPLPLASIHSRR